MSRFSSFKYASSETRRTLRNRFVSRLFASKNKRFIDPELNVTPDEILLRALENLKVISDEEWSRADVLYANAGPTNSEPPDLLALKGLGWIRQIWGRVKADREIRFAVRRAPAGHMDAFKALLSTIYKKSYEVNDAVQSDTELVELFAAFEDGHGISRQIVCRTPEWVAARIWEKALAHEATSGDALRRWVDMWAILDYPSFIPMEVWGEREANAFRDAAIEAISTEASLGGWAETRSLYARQMALAKNQDEDVINSWLPLIPSTLVERALWLQSQFVEGSVYESLDNCGDLFGLVRLLLANVDAVDVAPAPHSIMGKLIELAIDRAELFADLLFQIKARPNLLADLVIHPKTSGLACLLISQWQLQPNAWDRSLAESDHKLGQAEAFTDAVSIFGENLRAGKSDVSEAAALLNWLHRVAEPRFIDDLAGIDLLIDILRRELAKCTSSMIFEAAQSLDGEGFRKGLGAPEFATFLDLVDLGGIESEVDADAIVSAYACSIAAGEYSLSAHRIGIKGAAALARIAGREEAIRNKFLYPFDVTSKLASVTSGDEEFGIMNSVGLSLRAHMRVLCRAVIGGEKEVPSDLFEALISAVKSGAIQHKERGRVAAFAPGFEQQIALKLSDRPLAADLSAVLSFIDKNRQEKLLAVILETDEPLILAQLLSRSQARLRHDIEKRLAALAPADAGVIRSLTEVQARIDELLAAGAADAAESYMAAEVDIQTWGNVAGRDLVRFRNQLRLNLLREDWVAISEMPEPDMLRATDKAEAAEYLQQARALMAINGPNPNPKLAKQVFKTLFSKRKFFGFASNWFAAEVSDLLHEDNFGILKGEDIRKGWKAIDEIEQMIAQLVECSADESLACNRAMLLLAMAEPGQALSTLSTVPFVRLQAEAVAYRAIALARLGRQAEATAALDSAEYNFGRSALFDASRAHIASGAPYLSVPSTSVYDSLVDNVASALSRFRLMNPADQARVLMRQEDPFEALLVDCVRAAADAVIALVPMMKGVQINSIEDDLTAFIQHLLAARVNFFGWSVADQSKGGFTAKGNPGERDLLVAWGGSVLALIEAVVCDKPLTQDVMKADLESHFQKLLGYGNPRIFFHLTYAYGEEMKELMQFLEEASENASPQGFAYVGRTPIPHEDSRPPGFVASYAADFGEVKVIFLVLNLGQRRQRHAAKLAAKTKARKAPVQQRMARKGPGAGMNGGPKGENPQR